MRCVLPGLGPSDRAFRTAGRLPRPAWMIVVSAEARPAPRPASVTTARHGHADSADRACRWRRSVARSRLRSTFVAHGAVSPAHPSRSRPDPGQIPARSRPDRAEVSARFSGQKACRSLGTFLYSSGHTPGSGRRERAVVETGQSPRPGSRRDRAVAETGQSPSRRPGPPAGRTRHEAASRPDYRGDHPDRADSATRTTAPPGRQGAVIQIRATVPRRRRARHPWRPGIHGDPASMIM